MSHQWVRIFSCSIQTKAASETVRGDGGGDGGGAFAFSMWTSLPSQPFSKAKTSFLAVPVEARLVRASCRRLG